MNILYICYASSIEGRGNIDIFTPARELIKHGNKLHLVLRGDGKAYDIQGSAGCARVYPLIPPLPTAFFAFPLTLWKIHRLVRRTSPDVLISSGNLHTPFLAAIISRLTGVPLVIVFRQMFWETVYHDRTKSTLTRLITLAPLKLSHLLFRRAKHLVAIFAGIRDFYTEVLKREDIRLINLECVNIEEYVLNEGERRAYRAGLGIGDREKVILYTGALEPPRLPGLMALLDVFSRLRKEKDIRLVIAGSGDSRRGLMARVKEMGLSDAVIFPSWLPKSDIIRLTHAADICVEPFVRPYPQFYTPSDKLLDYMACARCVVATNIQSHASLIENGVSGVLYSSEQELMDKLGWLLRDDEMRESLGVRARERVASTYEVKMSVPLFEEFCREVISGHRAKNKQLGGERAA